MSVAINLRLRKLRPDMRAGKDVKARPPEKATT